MEHPNSGFEGRPLYLDAQATTPMVNICLRLIKNKLFSDIAANCFKSHTLYRNAVIF